LKKKKREGDWGPHFGKDPIPIAKKIPASPQKKRVFSPNNLKKGAPKEIETLKNPKKFNKT